MEISGWNLLQKLLFKYFFNQYLLIITGVFLPFLNASSQGYFQQEVNYKIKVTLNDSKHELNAYESVEYINNSPDTLRFLYFHLWPNAYSDNNTELAKEMLNREGRGKLFNDPDLKGYIDSLDFAAEGIQVQWNLLPGFHDICRLNLNSHLKPGDTISITTPFHLKIPEGVTSRLGHIGESYQISQWYPKPAVYDKSGWHQMPYLDQGEFFSEYGSFDVTITLPSNYVVGATGNLQNEDEKRLLDSLSHDTSWMKTVDNWKTDFPPSSNRMKTLRYTENRIHDFAWFADKRFHVLKGKVRLPDSGRVVNTLAMFTNEEAGLWSDAISYINNAVWYFSKWIGDYPYDNFTAVQSALNSGAGMEYPGLTVIGLAKDPYLLDEVIAHEICHSWFYSSIGSDERRFPYMDESTASAYESRYMEYRYPNKKLWEVAFRNRKLAKIFKIDEIPVQRMQEFEWLIPSRMNTGQPLNLAAPAYSYDNYGSMVYYKAGQGLNFLRAYLGDTLFDTAMHDYYITWKNRHPQPEDIRKIFESLSSRDLSWFFDDFLGTDKRLDYKIARLENGKVLVKNKGGLKAPLLIAELDGDSVISEKWVDGFEGQEWISLSTDNYTEIRIDPEHKMTELYRLNNNIRISGIFRKGDPLNLRFLYTIEDPDKQLIQYFPSIDWNRSDGFMAGAAFHNGTLILKPVEYFVMPFYTFRDPGLAGYGKISFNRIPFGKSVRLARFSLEGEKFGAPGAHDYYKAKIGLDIYFRPHDAIRPLNQKIYGYYIAASDLNQVLSLKPSVSRSYIQLGYQLEKTRVINPYNVNLSFESGKSFQKTSLELNYKYSYYGKKDGLDIRLFAGTMLRNSSENTFYAFSPDGRGGTGQYLYGGIYPDRFTSFPGTFWSRQMSLTEGGLVTPVSDSIGYSRSLISISLTSSLPKKASMIPVKPFVNILLNDHGRGSSDRSILFCEAGLKTGIWDFLEIYFPFFVSDNIRALSGTFKDRIRFTFRLDKLNPARLK